MLEHSSPHFSIRPTAGNGVTPQFSSIVAVDEIAKHDISPGSRSSDDGEAAPLKRTLAQSQRTGANGSGTSGTNIGSAGNGSGSSSSSSSNDGNPIATNNNKVQIFSSAKPHASDTSVRSEGPLIASFDEDGVSRDTRPQDSVAESEEALLRKPAYKLAPMAPIPQLKPQVKNQQHQQQQQQQQQQSETRGGDTAPKNNNNIASRGQLLGPMEPMELKKANDHPYRVRKINKSSPGFPPFPGLPMEDPGMVSAEHYDSTSYGGDSEGYEYVRYDSMNSKSKRKKEHIPSMSEVSRLADAVAAEHHAHSNDEYRRTNERNGEFPNNLLSEMYSQTINPPSMSYSSYGYARANGDSYAPHPPPPPSFQRKLSFDVISDFNQPRPPNSPSLISGVPLLGYGGMYLDGNAHTLPPPSTSHAHHHSQITLPPPVDQKTLENTHGAPTIIQGSLTYNINSHGSQVGPQPTKENESNDKHANHHHHHHHHHSHDHQYDQTNVNMHSCQGDCQHDHSHSAPDSQAQYARQLVHHNDYNHYGSAEAGTRSTDAQHHDNASQSKALYHHHGHYNPHPVTTASATPAYPIVFSTPAPPTMGVSQVLPFSMVSPPGPVPAPALAPPLALPSSSHAHHHGEKTPLQRQSNNVPPPQSEERIYRCTHPGCEWSFTRSSDFKRHLRSHEKPSLKCPYWELETDCNRKGGMFYRLDVLKRHLRLVHLIRPTDGSNEGGQCRVCLKKFSRTKDFIAHCEGCAKEAVAKKNAAKAEQAQAEAAS